MEKMLEKAREIKGLKKKISAEAKRVGLKCNTEERQTRMFKVFQKIYYSKVKTLLGLGESTYFFTAAAPIAREVCQLSAGVRATLLRVPTVQVVNYFLSLDIKLTEVYGMSESTGIHTLNPPGKIKFGSVGVNSDVTVKSKLVKVSQSELS